MWWVVVGGVYFGEFSKRRIIYLCKTYFDIQQKLLSVIIDLITSLIKFINVTQHTTSRIVFIINVTECTVMTTLLWGFAGAFQPAYKRLVVINAGPRCKFAQNV